MFAEHLGEDIDKKVCLECQRQFTGIVAACPHDGTTLVTLARDPMIGTCLMGKYDIIDVIGHGGMGVVYKGRQVLMERVVAIKMLQSQHIADSMSVKRFHQEGKASSKLNHPHVITVYDFGVTPATGQPFIVMDYLLGISLADLIKNEGQVGVERSIKVLTQATDALDHAHRMGVIHRDLKPSNIMLIEYEDEKDYVKVVDFGVAKLITTGGEQQKLTQIGEVCGSPVYMSPEQVQGFELDNRSDIYSMGVVIYETLTGRLPILGKTMVETMSKHITEMPPRFNEIRPDLYIPERLEAVIFKAMAKSPDDRHQTMAELTRELDAAIPRAGKAVSMRTEFPTVPSKNEKQSSFVSRLSLMHWMIITACIVGVVCLAAAAIMSKKPLINTNPTQTVVTPPPASTTPAAATTPPANATAPAATTTGPAATTTAPAATRASTTAPASSTATTAAVTSPTKDIPASDTTGSASLKTGKPAVVSTDTDTKHGAEATRPEPPKSKPKVATAPKPHKPRHKVVEVEEAPAASGAAAAYARRSAATGGDPFKSLLKSRGY